MLWHLMQNVLLLWIQWICWWRSQSQSSSMNLTLLRHLKLLWKNASCWENTPTLSISPNTTPWCIFGWTRPFNHGVRCCPYSACNVGSLTHGKKCTFRHPQDIELSVRTRTVVGLVGESVLMYLRSDAPRILSLWVQPMIPVGGWTSLIMILSNRVDLSLHWPCLLLYLLIFDSV